MRLSRIHTEQPLTAGQRVTLDADQAHYLGKVLRARPSHQFALFNGQDGEFIAEIVAVNKRDIELEILAVRAAVPDSGLQVHIGMGLSRGERMDYAVQKATELGVSSLTPLFTDFSEVKLSRRWRPAPANNAAAAAYRISIIP